MKTIIAALLKAFRFLFEEVGPNEPNALALPEGTVPDGRAVAPTRRATDLVAYLQSLQQPELVGAVHE